MRKTTLQVALPPMEVKAVVRHGEHEDNALVLKRRFLRESIDESGWKHDAVARALNIDGPYLSKLLAGEKTLTLKHLDAMPDEIERLYHQKCAESHGLIVVRPLEGQAAVKGFVGGLMGLLLKETA